MKLDRRTALSRRTFVLASVSALFPTAAIPASGAAAAETLVEAGQDLGIAIAKAGAGGIRRVRLRPGLHGPLALAGFSKTMEIVGDPGAVVGPTVLRASSGVHFRQIAFRGERKSKDAAPSLVQVTGDSSAIRFSGCSFASADDVGSWRDVDWVERPYGAGLLVRGRGVRLTKCRFFNLRNCLGLAGDGGIVEQSTFEAFGNDAIDFGANDLQILNNVIRGGRHTPAEPLHADGMQGFPAPNGGIFTNIVIDGNVVDFVGPGDYMQGISIFDGRWKNVRVTNNKVSVNAWNAIAMYGVDGILVENNIVSSTDPKIRNWIEVRASKGGAPSKNVVVSKNIAPLFKTGPEAKVANNQIRFR